MKKIFVFVMSATLLAACDNPLEYKPENRADELIVNALLDASESSHFVHLAVSSTEYVREVRDAELRCYVNGELKAKTSEFENIEMYGGTVGAGMRFDASFKAGDLVRIEVDAEGKFFASNEQVVPEPLKINKIDTVRVKNDVYRVNVNITDVNGGEEDFYRLQMENLLEEDVYNDDKYLCHVSGQNECSLDTDNDPVLSEGHIGNDDTLFELGGNNYYGIFGDALFNGESVTLHPEVSLWLNSWLYPYDLEEEFNRVTVTYSLRVKVMHLSKRNYYYLKALNSLRDGSTDLALEDVQIPDNVEGGIGFVGISNSASRVFRLKNAVYNDLHLYDDGAYPYYDE